MEIIILGQNPPTKEVAFLKDKYGHGVIIFDAEWDKDTEPYKPTAKKPKHRGRPKCWLQFVDVQAMRVFGQTLVDMANREVQHD